MKRVFLLQNANFFLCLPTEVLNKIQSLFLIVSLIHFGRVSKDLYEIQTAYMACKEKETYLRCIQRMRSHLDAIDLLHFVELFLPRFASVIKGGLVVSYLRDIAISFVIRIAVPKFVNFDIMLNYTQNNLNNEIYGWDYDYNSIYIYNREKNTKLELKIQQFNLESVNNYLIDISPCTDLKQVYCKNLWYLLKCEEDVEEIRTKQKRICKE